MMDELHGVGCIRSVVKRCSYLKPLHVTLNAFVLCSINVNRRLERRERISINNGCALMVFGSVECVHLMDGTVISIINSLSSHDTFWWWCTRHSMFVARLIEHRFLINQTAGRWVIDLKHTIPAYSIILRSSDCDINSIFFLQKRRERGRIDVRGIKLVEPAILHGDGGDASAPNVSVQNLMTDDCFNLQSSSFSGLSVSNWILRTELHNRRKQYTADIYFISRRSNRQRT